jgi:hypothetical protein
MTMKCFVKAAGITAVALFLMVASASASLISFTTNAAGTAFVSTGNDTLLPTFESGGVTASLVFTPNTLSGINTPTGVDLGDFLLTCAGCSTYAAQTAFAVFPSFVFDLVVTDTTDGASGTFVGTSSGTATPVYNNQSAIVVNWAPLQLGPGTGAWTGNFGSTYFVTTNPTVIVAPISGTPPGDSSIQGVVSSLSGVPEPATFLLLGAGLLGLGVLRRKRA